MINPSPRNHQNPDSAFYEIGQWMKNLSENGSNYIRVWLSESFWDIEDDILFAPFFSGSAGAGMSWHWESYVHRNNLWYHFQRFNEVIKGINPIKEGFVPSKAETRDLRVYLLKGKKTNLVWFATK